MKKYTKIVDFLEQIKTWENEEEFLIDALVLSNAKLFIKCFRDLGENSLVTIAPLLRQIQENIMAILGIADSEITMQEFIDKSYNTQKVMLRIQEKNKDIDEYKFKLTNDYFNNIKDVLNKFTHTNFEGIMTLFTERYQVHESIEFNKIMMKFFISLLERPYIAIVNSAYELGIEYPQIMNNKKELKKVNTLKYITRHFPEPTRDFINNSNVLNNYYKDIVNKLKNLEHDIQDIDN